MGTPLLSVCIPVFNGAPYIGLAVESVLCQDFDDYELLIVDNSSTDATIDIVQAYGDRRIRLSTNSRNMGMVANWNRALELARGKFLKVLPADDLLYPGALRAQCEVLEKDTTEEVALVCGRKNLIDQNGRVLFNRGFSRREVRVGGTQAINRTIRSGGNVIGEGGASLFRRKLLSRTGYFVPDIFYVFDLDLWFRLLLHGSLHSLPIVVSAFRLSGTAESTRIRRLQLRDHLRFLKKVYNSECYRVSRTSYAIGSINAVALGAMKRLLYSFILE